MFRSVRKWYRGRKTRRFRLLSWWRDSEISYWCEVSNCRSCLHNCTSVALPINTVLLRVGNSTTFPVIPSCSVYSVKVRIRTFSSLAGTWVCEKTTEILLDGIISSFFIYPRCLCSNRLYSDMYIYVYLCCDLILIISCYIQIFYI